MAEHVHEWLYVSQPGPIEYGKFLDFSGDKLYRFCLICDAKQAMTPDGIVAELEQRLFDAKALLSDALDGLDGSDYSTALAAKIHAFLAHKED